jgi:hypothetical protein
MPPPGNHRHDGYERRNERSFGEHAQGLMLWRAIGLGLAIPALVDARTRAGDALYIQRS